MKYILAPILLLVLLLLALGQTLDDLVEREGIYYKRFTDVPFTGKTTGKIQGTFRNGKKEGLWVRYYENGQLWYETTYKDGKWNGPWVGYYPDGQISSKGTHKDDKKVGLWVHHYKNGQIEEKGTYKDGVKISD